MFVLEALNSCSPVVKVCESQCLGRFLHLVPVSFRTEPAEGKTCCCKLHFSYKDPGERSNTQKCETIKPTRGNVEKEKISRETPANSSQTDYTKDQSPARSSMSILVRVSLFLLMAFFCYCKQAAGQRRDRGCKWNFLIEFMLPGAEYRTRK